MADRMSPEPLTECSGMRRPGLRGDIGKLFAALCPASRRVALAVSHLSVAEAARALGLHRSSVYDRLSSIRETAIALGLGEYFEASPTVTAARR